MSVHYSIRYPNWLLHCLESEFIQFSWQLFAVTREMTWHDVSDEVQIITIDMKLTKTEWLRVNASEYICPLSVDWLSFYRSHDI